ncbi:Uncharacterized protein TCM_035254 [Theobroma cacao]|uniref:Uncharacterized protein n=1 Tax=Theobroma cacao TaxID=3641 RepID=A0A061FHC8_THECC|nr:Uncharacterized protein TCM_035254 [Theobroma cacao]
MLLKEHWICAPKEHPSMFPGNTQTVLSKEYQNGAPKEHHVGEHPITASQGTPTFGSTRSMLLRSTTMGAPLRILIKYFLIRSDMGWSTVKWSIVKGKRGVFAQ